MCSFWYLWVTYKGIDNIAGFWNSSALGLQKSLHTDLRSHEQCIKAPTYIQPQLESLPASVASFCFLCFCYCCFVGFVVVVGFCVCVCVLSIVTDVKWNLSGISLPCPLGLRIHILVSFLSVVTKYPRRSNCRRKGLFWCEETPSHNWESTVQVHTTAAHARLAHFTSTEALRSALRDSLTPLPLTACTTFPKQCHQRGTRCPDT